MINNETSEDVVTQWNVLPLFKVWCTTCRRSTISERTSPTEAIQECIDNGWQLGSNGPVCDDCVYEEVNS